MFSSAGDSQWTFLLLESLDIYSLLVFRNGSGALSMQAAETLDLSLHDSHRLLHIPHQFFLRWYCDMNNAADL